MPGRRRPVAEKGAELTQGLGHRLQGQGARSGAREQAADGRQVGDERLRRDAVAHGDDRHGPDRGEDREEVGRQRRRGGPGDPRLFEPVGGRLRSEAGFGRRPASAGR
jgi:hypothetical protein